MHSHLRVKDARIGLHHTNGLVESLQRICRAFLVGYHSRQVELQVLRLQLRRKAVTNAITLPARNFDIVSRGSKIADDSRLLTAKVSCPKVAANEDNGDGFGLFIADGEKGLGWVAVYKFDTEDLGGGERGRNFHCEIGRGGRLLCLCPCFFSLGNCQWVVDRWPFGGLHLALRLSELEVKAVLVQRKVYRPF